MRALEDSETTVLFVEHDMDIVGRYAERVLAFYAGRIIADGSRTPVLSNAEVQRYVTGSDAMSRSANRSATRQAAVGRGAAWRQPVARARRDGRLAWPQWRRQDDDLRAVMGLVAASAGRISCGGEDLTALPTYRRAALGIGYMPEDRRLVPQLSVEENILLPSWARMRVMPRRGSISSMA